MEFKQGDRVRINPATKYTGRISHSDVGTIQGKECSDSYYIRWDHHNEWKHNNGRLCDRGHGWIVRGKYLTLDAPDDLGEFPTPDCLDTKFLFGM